MKKPYSKPKLEKLSRRAAIARLKAAAKAGNVGAEDMLEADRRIRARDHSLPWSTHLEEKLWTSLEALKTARTRKQKQTLIHEMMEFLRAMERYVGEEGTKGRKIHAESTPRIRTD